MDEITQLDGADARERTSFTGLLIATVATLGMCPAVSIPGGLTCSGLPIGIAIMGRNRDGAKLIGHAAYVEQASGLSVLTPIEPRC